MPKLIDCITFFQENFIFDLRYNILKDYVDLMVVCESKYDHRGNFKKLNFDFKKNYNTEKIKYLVLEEPFPKNNNSWNNQAVQREFILKNLNFVDDNDYIMFSDPDEIPNPKILKNLKLKKKYGIFFQKMFTFKLNLFNKYETPWEGTRICKKKHLKSFDWLRQKVVSKNLKKGFWRIDKEKNIEIIDNGGWHFNYLLEPKDISKKFKSLAETSWDKEEFYDEKIIEAKIKNKEDLFNRGHKFEQIVIDESYPDYIKNNKNKYSKWIINE